MDAAYHRLARRTYMPQHHEIISAKGLGFFSAGLEVILRRGTSSAPKIGNQERGIRDVESPHHKEVGASGPGREQLGMAGMGPLYECTQKDPPSPAVCDVSVMDPARVKTPAAWEPAFKKESYLLPKESSQREDFHTLTISLHKTTTPVQALYQRPSRESEKPSPYQALLEPTTIESKMPSDASSKSTSTFVARCDSSTSSTRSSSSIARMKAILQHSTKKPVQTKAQSSSNKVVMEARASYFANR
ncbi:predicted protein [Histoplasma capsulatum H143]|uniref:Uncharacterized protein n=1 Tax=Ajellomyces capsulatus (strain H143) TaxID=544712 RepID=C6HJY6_AJECH|nr:predicted protein [Histoplasma capsulatum H143]